MPDLSVRPRPRFPRGFVRKFPDRKHPGNRLRSPSPFRPRCVAEKYRWIRYSIGQLSIVYCLRSILPSYSQHTVVLHIGGVSFFVIHYDRWSIIETIVNFLQCVLVIVAFISRVNQINFGEFCTESLLAGWCHLFCGMLLLYLLITPIKYKTVFVVRSWCLLSCYRIGNSRLFHGV